MFQLPYLYLAQMITLAAGTIFAWYTVFTELVVFYGVYGTLFRFVDCTPPNPFLQACFYGAFVFLLGLWWSIKLYQNQSDTILKRQLRLVYLLIVGTLFGWSNFAFMLYTAKSPAPVGNSFTCTLTEATSPFSTDCFIGSAFFTVSLAISFIIYLHLKRRR